MNCFNHPQHSALGICRVCCKGLCADCTADLGHSLACKGLHEDDAAAVNALTVRSTRLFKATRKSRFLGPLFFGICGLVFMVDGLRQDVIFNFASYLGAAFIVFSVAMLVANASAYGGNETPGV